MCFFKLIEITNSINISLFVLLDCQFDKHFFLFALPDYQSGKHFFICQSSEFYHIVNEEKKCNFRIIKKVYGVEKI